MTTEPRRSSEVQVVLVCVDPLSKSTPAMSPARFLSFVLTCLYRQLPWNFAEYFAEEAWLFPDMSCVRISLSSGLVDSVHE